MHERGRGVRPPTVPQTLLNLWNFWWGGYPISLFAKTPKYLCFKLWLFITSIYNHSSELILFSFLNPNLLCRKFCCFKQSNLVFSNSRAKSGLSLTSSIWSTSMISSCIVVTLPSCLHHKHS